MQSRTIFIGGAPRLGKTILAHDIAQRLGGDMVSTDWIKNAVKKSHTERQGDLFVFDKLNLMSDDDFVNYYTNKPQTLLNDFEALAGALWPSIESFCNGFYDDDFIHVVEGADIQPKLVANMKKPPKLALFIGNTSKEYLEAAMKYSDETSSDWMKALNYTSQKKQAVIEFSVFMSQHIKEQAAQYGYHYIEIADFVSQREIIVNDICAQFTNLD